MKYFQWYLTYWDHIWLDFFSVFNVGIHNVQIELINNCPCDDAYSWKWKQTEIIEKMIKDMKINKIYIYKKITYL